MKIRLIVLALILTGCNNPTTPKKQPQLKHFANLTGIVSPYMDYQPRGEIDTTNTDHPSHYEVFYDTQNRISEIRYFKNNKKSNAAYYGTHKVSYNYYGDSLIRSYYNTKDKKAYMSRHYYGGGTIHEEVFYLNTKGMKKELVLKDSSGQRTSTGFGTYTYRWKNHTPKTCIQEQYTSDRKHNLLTTYFPFYSSRITVDHNAHLFSIENLDTITNSPIHNKQAGYAKVLFNFDKYGNEKGWSFHALNNTLLSRKKVLGMEYGYAKVVYTFKWRNEALGQYSSFTMDFLDANQQPVLNDQGIHRTLYEFDTHENLIGLAYFGVSKNPIQHPAANYHRLKISYDENDIQQEVLKFDSTGTVME